ncbi:MAG: YjbQ family protein [Dehalococcoidia bacterium]|nr:YjbQ family protein [Dehalococcoidia bacterium]
MTAASHELTVQTRGDGDVLNLTAQLNGFVSASGVGSGLVTVAVVGSTAGITTIEYEPGLVADLRKAFERVAPSGVAYEHDARWGDGNGHAHVRASLLGPSVTLPVVAGALALGTWQQVVLVDFDTRPRTRRIVFQVLGQ